MHLARKGPGIPEAGVKSWVTCRRPGLAGLTVMRENIASARALTCSPGSRRGKRKGGRERGGKERRREVEDRKEKKEGGSLPGGSSQTCFMPGPTSYLLCVLTANVT